MFHALKRLFQGEATETPVVRDPFPLLPAVVEEPAPQAATQATQAKPAEDGIVWFDRATYKRLASISGDLRGKRTARSILYKTEDGVSFYGIPTRMLEGDALWHSVYALYVRGFTHTEVEDGARVLGWRMRKNGNAPSQILIPAGTDIDAAMRWALQSAAGAETAQTKSEPMAAMPMRAPASETVSVTAQDEIQWMTAAQICQATGLDDPTLRNRLIQHGVAKRKGSLHDKLGRFLNEYAIPNGDAGFLRLSPLMWEIARKKGADTQAPAQAQGLEGVVQAKPATTERLVRGVPESAYEAIVDFFREGNRQYFQGRRLAEAQGLKKNATKILIGACQGEAKRRNIEQYARRDATEVAAPCLL